MHGEVTVFGSQPFATPTGTGPHGQNGEKSLDIAGYAMNIG